ncbi:MAG: hypothetical protein HYZ50_16545 [Deltaproteobacteria bacterium]|nr:hypothetical protein [Deltaproteobacteria bacterium]
MTFLLYLTGVLFIGAIASFVASPLFLSPTLPETERVTDHEMLRWEKQKTDAYTAIKEAEFDLQMGKLTQEDYQLLRDKYEARALDALARLDQLRGTALGSTSASSS